MASFVVLIALAAFIMSVVALALSYPVARANGFGNQTFLQTNGFVATDGSTSTVISPNSILINSNPIPQILANNVAEATQVAPDGDVHDVTPIVNIGTGLVLPVDQLREGTILVFTLGGRYETNLNGVYELSLRHGARFSDSIALLTIIAETGIGTIETHEKQWQTTILMRCSNPTQASVTFYNTASYSASFVAGEDAYPFGIAPSGDVLVNASLLHFHVGVRMLAPVNLESFTVTNLNLLRYG